MFGFIGKFFDNLGTAKQDFEQARNSHLRRPRTGMPLTGASADWHIRNEAHWLTLVELPRALDRDSPVIRQALNRFCDKVAGSKFQLQANTGDEVLNDALEAEVLDWANDRSRCDAQGKRDLQEIGWQCLRHVQMDGDCFVIPREEGFLSTFEAHRFRSTTPTVLGQPVQTGSHGIALDENDRPQWYFMTRGDLGFTRTIKSNQIDPIAAYDSEGYEQVFHIHRPERFTGRRGISVMAPILDITSYHDDTTFATCIANQLQTFFAIIHEFAQGQPGQGVPSMHGGGGDVKGEQEQRALPNGTQALIEKVFGPIEIFAQRGETIKGFHPTIPGVQFSPFMLHLLGLIACNLGIPLAVLLLDARPELTGSYSAWRGAQSEAREGYRKQQRFLINHFYDPVYRWRLRRLIAAGEAKGYTRKDGTFESFASAAKRLGAKFFAHEWKPPAWPYMDPTKDVASDVMRGETAQSSLERIHADNGQDFEPEHKTWVKNRKFQIVTAIEAATDLVQQFPDLDDKPTWRDLYPLVAGQAGAQLVLASHQADDVPPAKPAEPPPTKGSSNGTGKD